LVLLPVFLSAFSVEDSFVSWVRHNNKRYSHENEYQYRLSVYRQNLDFIENHNRLNLGFTVAMNKFGDLTLDEFKILYLATRVNSSFLSQQSTPSVYSPPPTADEVDWRTKGAVTGVKDQGQCGSCWAFSATGSIEGAWFLTNNALVSVSEQQLVDCSGAYGNYGCDGGLMDSAFEYLIKSSKGIEKEEDYKYTARDGTCKFEAGKIAVSIDGYKDIPKDEKQLQTAIQKQPISVAIDAGHSSFQFYHSGVYNEPACSSSNLDHGVLAVGYGTSSTNQDYYIVKNSWGTNWGAQGYILMTRNKNNQCGIATMSSFPIAKKN